MGYVARFQPSKLYILMVFQLLSKYVNYAPGIMKPKVLVKAAVELGDHSQAVECDTNPIDADFFAYGEKRSGFRRKGILILW